MMKIARLGRKHRKIIILIFILTTACWFYWCKEFFRHDWTPTTQVESRKFVGNKSNSEDDCDVPGSIVDGVPWPNCRKRLSLLKSNPTKDLCGFDDTCSILHYLSSVEKQCPMQEGQGHRKERLYFKGLRASAREQVGELYQQLGEISDYAWMKNRIKSMESLWLSAAKEIFTNNTQLVVSKKRIHIHLGLMKMGFGKQAFAGGALGELLQWSDVIASLHIIGHDIILTRDQRELNAVYAEYSKEESEPCAARSKNAANSFPFDLVYTDIVGYKDVSNVIPNKILQRIKCRFRILDSFGTEADFNDENYRAAKGREKSDFTGLDMDLRQFNTMYPHTPDNTFIGFVIEKPYKHTEKSERNIALLYGKLERYVRGKENTFDIIREYIPEVHATLQGAGNLPSYITNHGVLEPKELFKLLQKTKVLIGLGHPFEGSGPLEAIEQGAIFLNPRLDDPISYKGKPTSRKVTSQNFYAEKYIGKPHVYTIDINNEKEIRSAMQEIADSPEPGEYLLYEFSAKGMMKRIALQVENQEFCVRAPYSNANLQLWPPLTAMTITSTPEGVEESCNDACEKLGLICEPSFFPVLNQRSTIEETFSVKCAEMVMPVDPELDYPAFNPKGGKCYLQTNPRLFSCAGNYLRMRRLCPCRDFVKGQIALCQACGQTMS